MPATADVSTSTACHLLLKPLCILTLRTNALIFCMCAYTRLILFSVVGFRQHVCQNAQQRTQQQQQQFVPKASQVSSM